MTSEELAAEAKARNLPKEAVLWGKLYGLLCRWPTIQYGLASMPERDQPRLDDLAEKMIRESGAFSADR